MAARLFETWTRKEASTAAQREEPILKHKFQGHERTIRSFVFLHDNAHIVSGSMDGTMRKWNCETGLVVGEPWKGQGGCIYALALPPDVKLIACGREDGNVQRWSTDGEMMEGIWTSHGEVVWSLSWPPSGSQITSGSDGGTILIRNADSGEVKLGPIMTEQEGVYALLGACCMSFLDVAHQLTSPFPKNGPSVVSSVVALTQTHSWSSHP